jgi:protein ImuB
MLWIALYLPELSLQIAERGAGQGHALVIASGPDNRPTVFAANAIAHEAGIKTGMTVASARTLANELHIVPRQAAAEMDAVENYASWACQFTPSVAIKGDEGVLLEVASTLTMHDGISMLLGKLRRGTHELGYHASCGVAPTPLAAWLIAKARHHGYAVRACTDKAEIEARLADLPLALLDWSYDTLSKLSALGIVRIGDFLKLPSEGVAKRFGEECWFDLQRALGRLPDPRPYFTPPETYRSRTEFGFEVNDAMALLFPLKRLLSELEGFLRARGAGLLEFGLHLEHSDHSRSTITVGVGRPERKADRLLSLSREHLTRAVLPATVLAMAVDVNRLVPFVEISGSWLPDPREQADGWYQLIDKFIARLGGDNVYRLQAVDDFRPEQAWKPIGPTVPWKSAKPRDIGMPRPLFLLPVPRKLHLDQGAPLCHGKVNMVAGPERIEAGWWDGKPALRDYYVGRNPHGETLWLYRELHDATSWHLHGYFS